MPEILKTKAGGAPTDTALFTVSDKDRWAGELRNLLTEYAPVLARIEVLQQRLRVFEDAEKERLGDATGPLPPARIVADSLDAPPNANAAEGPGRPGKPLAPADEFLRQHALRIGRDKPEGFDPQDVWLAFVGDYSIPEEIKKVGADYIYIAMKRMRADGVLDKRGKKYVLPNSDPHPTGVGVAPGFKVVPMTKEERIKEETARYLGKRKYRKAHRTQILEHLMNVGIMGTEKKSLGALTIYLSRWPEFQSDGDGNYVHVTGVAGDGS